MRHFLAALAVALALFAVPACSTVDRFLGGDVIENAAPSEKPVLRVRKAQLVVEGAYTTIDRQLAKGLLNVNQAEVAMAQIDRARDGVKAAQAALAVSANPEDALANVDALIEILLLAPFMENEGD